MLTLQRKKLVRMNSLKNNLDNRIAGLRNPPFETEDGPNP